MSNSSDTIPTKNPSRDKTDHYYELHVQFERGGDYSVYYRTPMELSPQGVAKYAVRDGDLLDVFMQNVDYVLEITPEEYFEHMWE